MMDRPSIAFFDVDHTLTHHATALRFAALALRRGHLNLHELLSVPFHALRYRLGLPTRGKFQTAMLEVPPLAGIPRKVFDELCAECFETMIGRDLYPPALELVQTLKAQGVRIVLATSSLDLIVKPLADYLGVEDMLASELEFEDGVATGKLRGGAIFGGAKLAAARELAERLGHELGAAAFYSDSFHDLPLLRAVGFPCAVNPDLRLRRVARNEGWDILDFRRR